MVAINFFFNSLFLKEKRELDRIQQRSYWPGWSQDVQDYVLSCEVCQRIKPSHTIHEAPMKIIESNFPFEILTTDIGREFNDSDDGNIWVLIIVDHFTKFAQAYAMPIYSVGYFE
jgi:hypothetical protein